VASLIALSSALDEVANVLVPLAYVLVMVVLKLMLVSC
jgi:hypothetical protein